jgi:anti-sigma factor RsiW
VTCEEIDAFLMAYLDGALPPARLERFEEHLAGCAQCRVYLLQYRQTVLLGQSAFDAASPTPVPRELVGAILSARWSD